MPVFPYYNNNRRMYFYNRYFPNNYGYNFTPSPASVPNHNQYNKKTSFESDSNSASDLKQSKNEDVWLDLFGIKLYFDDVLILSLLFFLYKEEVKDEGLFLSLILLLIS